MLGLPIESNVVPALQFGAGGAENASVSMTEAAAGLVPVAGAGALRAFVYAARRR